MKATAPFMSAFVIYIMSLGGAAVALKSFRRALLQSKYLGAFILLLTAVTLYLVSSAAFISSSVAKSAAEIKGDFPPNEPIGIAQGVFPGRVVWMRNANATNENCTNTSNNNGMIDAGDDAWFMARNNNMAVIDSMIHKSLLAVSGAETDASAWDLIFRYFNENHGQGISAIPKGGKKFC